MKKTQHYIPQLILKGFSNDKNQVIEMLIPQKKIYPTDPANAMAENYTYEHSHFEPNSIEDFFARIEGKVAPEIEGLQNEIVGLTKGQVDISQIKEKSESLYKFFILSYYRSGALLTEFSMPDKKYKVPLLTEKILNLDYVEDLAKTIKYGYDFAILQSDQDFLISDQCISTVALKLKSRFFDVSNRHIGLQETLILVPISSSYYIALWNSKYGFGVKPNTIHFVDKELLHIINRAILNNSYIKCVAQKKERLEEVQNEFITQYPSQVFAGGNPKGYSTGAVLKKEVFLTDIETEANDLLHFPFLEKYRKAKVNDPCPCGSQKKFKKCHRDPLDRAQVATQTFRGPYPFTGCGPFIISDSLVIEQPIDKWAGFSDKVK